MTFRNALIIENAGQLDVLKAPMRLQLLAVMGRLGECSAAEVAREMGQSNQSIQYHIRALVDAGMVIVCGKRHANKRMERMFRLPGGGIEIDRTKSSPDYVAALVRVYSAALRYADRHLGKAVGRRADLPKAQNAATGLVQFNARLSNRAIRQVRRKIRDIQKFVIENEGTSRAPSYLVTLVVSSDVGNEK